MLLCGVRYGSLWFWCCPLEQLLSPFRLRIARVLHLDPIPRRLLGHLVRRVLSLADDAFQVPSSRSPRTASSRPSRRDRGKGFVSASDAVASLAWPYVRSAGEPADPCRSSRAGQGRRRCTGACGTEDHGSSAGRGRQRRQFLHRARHFPVLQSNGARCLFTAGKNVALLGRPAKERTGSISEKRPSGK